MTSRAELVNRQKAPLPTPSDIEPEAVTQISGALNILLADVFVLYFKNKELSLAHVVQLHNSRPGRSSSGEQVSLGADSAREDGASGCADRSRGSRRPGAGRISVGTVTELVDEECSGRTSIALSFLARITASGKDRSLELLQSGLGSGGRRRL
jgi:hypothetical protein